MEELAGKGAVMRTQLKGIASLVAMAALFSPRPAAAQCGANILGFDNVAPMPGNPFQAERMVSRAAPALPLTAVLGRSPERIARDGQGRVRIDRVGGKYTIKSGPEAGTEVDLHTIVICDPVSQTMTQLDSLNKTARIFPSVNRLATRLPPEPQSMCKRVLAGMLKFPGARSEDLGHQLIAGVDAEGVRMITPSLRPDVTSNVREEWCSEELGAMVLQVQYSTNAGKTGPKFETAMTNLQRGEPDAALFEIPADYAVSERVPETTGMLHAPLARPAAPQTPAQPAAPNPPPQK
jgi:hypothetical protein